MAISFNNALGVHEPALLLRTQRAQILANNLANVDTPHYKARDIDFQAVLQDQMQGRSSSSLGLNNTQSGHVQGLAFGAGDPNLLYRQPVQPSIDGNTVEIHEEQSKFMQNALDYQAGFRFLNGKFKGLTSAIKGE